MDKQNKNNNNKKQRTIKSSNSSSSGGSEGHGSRKSKSAHGKGGSSKFNSKKHIVDRQIGEEGDFQAARFTANDDDPSDSESSTSSNNKKKKETAEPPKPPPQFEHSHNDINDALTSFTVFDFKVHEHKLVRHFAKVFTKGEFDDEGRFINTGEVLTNVDVPVSTQWKSDFTVHKFDFSNILSDPSDDDRRTEYHQTTQLKYKDAKLCTVTVTSRHFRQLSKLSWRDPVLYLLSRDMEHHDKAGNIGFVTQTKVSYTISVELLMHLCNAKLFGLQTKNEDDLVLALTQIGASIGTINIDRQLILKNEGIWKNTELIAKAKYFFLGQKKNFDLSFQ